MAKKVGVVLSGCGVYDGSEIQDAVLTLLYLAQAGAEAVCLAPESDHADVVDHVTGASDESRTRSVFAESARICRGAIQKVDPALVDELDALILPGGFGAAKNLSDFAFAGDEATVDEGVEKLLEAFHKAKKPIGAMCIAPAVVAAALGGHKPLLTIGNEMGTASALESMGASHQDATVDEVVVDETNRIVSTPAYMLGPGIAEVARGIQKLVDQVLEWA